jgi:anti-sigma B factor antagonist
VTEPRALLEEPVVAEAPLRMVFRLGGQLLLGNRQQLKDAVTEAIALGFAVLELDARETIYMDSAGLGTLVTCAKLARKAQGDLSISNLSPDLRTLFELTRLEDLVRINPNTTSPDR